MNILSEQDTSYLEKYIFQDKLLKIMPSDFYKKIPQEHLTLLGHNHGIYGFPTEELIQWMSKTIGNNAIEIGAGRGSLGRALKIPYTDSKLMEEPEVAAYYKMMGQPTTEYPKDVIKMEALEAIDHYKPDIVIACWVTHKFCKEEAWREGSVYGVDEEILLRKVKKYILVGNDSVHGKKPIMERPHQSLSFPFLFSRSMKPELNKIYIWEGL